MKRSGAYEGKSDVDIRNEIMEIDQKVREIAEDNGFYFNSHHHDNEFLGMPWQIKKIYDEISDTIDELEADGRIID